ncbi:hypothetical protein D3C75_1321910 [compost metagenome]
MIALIRGKGAYIAVHIRHFQLAGHIIVELEGIRQIKREGIPGLVSMVVGKHPVIVQNDLGLLLYTVPVTGSVY